MKVIYRVWLLLCIVAVAPLIYLGWKTYNIQQDVDIINSSIVRISSFESQIALKNTKLTSKQNLNIQEKISKIQDFEDRRYNAITTQLNSFWSGVNGFLALVGIFFAIFSWYLVKQVESATKNIDELEKLKKDIGDYIADKSFELYKRTIKQDITQIIKSIKQSNNQEEIKSAYDILKLRINYVEMSDLIELYNSFHTGSFELKQSNPSFYYSYLSYYLVLMLFKNYKDMPDNLIQELIHALKTIESSLLIEYFMLLNDLCNIDITVGDKFGNKMSHKIKLEALYTDMVKNPRNTNCYNNSDNVNHIIEKWFGHKVKK